MRTTKPIATISFNTPEYLSLKLDELLKSGIISFWAFVRHKPEDDEGGLKYHQHVYVVPSKMLQTDDLRTQLKEFDPSHPDKPLGVLTWNSSRFDPWYLYAIHDKRYLASKGQTRKFHYAENEVISSDEDDLLCKVRSIDMLSLTPYEDIIEAQSQGVSWNDYFRRGTIPLPQIKLYQEAWYTLMGVDSTNRNGKPNHPMTVDENTGECFSGVDEYGDLEF